MTQPRVPKQDVPKQETDAQLLRRLKTGKSGEVTAHLLYGRAGKALYRRPPAVVQALNRLDRYSLIRNDLAAPGVGSRPTLTVNARRLLFGEPEPDTVAWDIAGWVLVRFTSGYETNGDRCRVVAYHYNDVGVLRPEVTPDLAAWLGWLARHTHVTTPGPYSRGDNLLHGLHFVLSNAGQNYVSRLSIRNKTGKPSSREESLALFEHIVRNITWPLFSQWRDDTTDPADRSRSTSRRQIAVCVWENPAVNPGRRVPALVAVRDGPRRTIVGLADFLERPQLVEDQLALSDI